MKIKRILRRLFGLALLVLFAFALYHYFLTAPKSGDSFSPPPGAAKRRTMAEDAEAPGNRSARTQTGKFWKGRNPARVYFPGIWKKT